MKIKIIILVHFPPKLNFTNAGKIKLPNGEETCFNNDNQYWFFTLGNQMMNRYSTKLIVEIWQPEPKTKEILVKSFNNGLVYKLFPAEYCNEFTITGIKKRLFSKRIMKELEKECTNKNTILHFRATTEYLTSKIVKTFYKKIILLGQFSINITNHFQINNHALIKKYYLLYRDLKPYKRFLLKVNNIIPGTQNDLRSELFFNRLNVFYRDNCANLGLDTEFWSSKKINIQRIKDRLGFDNNTKLLLLSSRLVKEKKIDTIIIALSKATIKMPYKLIITGSNDSYYGQKIKLLADNLLPNKVIFTGFLAENELRNYYAIADLLISNSLMEAGPFSVYQALLMGLPVIQTRVGIGAEVATKFKVTSIISPNHETNERELLDNINDYFRGIIPKTMNMIDAKKYFGWDTIAKYYLNVYTSLVSSKIN